MAFMTRDQRLIVEAFEKVYKRIDDGDSVTNTAIKTVCTSVKKLQDDNTTLCKRVDALEKSNNDLSKRVESLGLIVEVLSGLATSNKLKPPCDKISGAEYNGINVRTQMNIDAYNCGELITVHSPDQSCSRCELLGSAYDCDVFADIVDRDCTVESIIFAKKGDIYENRS